jgi:hypothetical protein
MIQNFQGDDLLVFIVRVYSFIPADALTPNCIWRQNGRKHHGVVDALLDPDIKVGPFLNTFDIDKHDTAMPFQILSESISEYCCVVSAIANKNTRRIIQLYWPTLGANPELAYLGNLTLTARANMFWRCSGYF